MAQSRYYSATAQPTVLTASITPTTTLIQVQQTVGFPINTPYILALDYNTPSEEVVLVTAQAGTNLTVTRGYDGTSATSHNSGAAVRHTWTAMDGNDSRSHEGSTAGVHGVVGNVVGTSDTQTLTNKTLNSAILNNPTVTNPTFSGTVNLVSPNITGTVTGGASYTAPTITSPSVTGTVSGGAVYLFPIFQADTDANPSLVARRRSATQIGALINFRDETNSSLAFVAFNGVARWRAGMSAGSADQMHVQANGDMDTTGLTTLTGGVRAGSTNQFAVDTSGNISTTGNLTVSGIGQTLFARKTADQPVLNSTTLVNDSNITFTVAANGVYVVSGLLGFTGSTTSDIKIGWTAPAGATFDWTPTTQNNTASTTVGSVITDRSALATSQSPGTIGAGSTLTSIINGLLVVGGTGGSFTLQFAQATLDAVVPSIMKAGTYIMLERVG